MSWISVGVAAVSAYASYDQQKQQGKATDRYNQGQAEMTKYSPWTGIRGQTERNTANPTGGAIQGGLAGLSMAQGFGGGAGGGAGDSAQKTEATPMAMNTSGQDMNGFQSEPTLFDSTKKSNPYKRNTMMS